MTPEEAREHVKKVADRFQNQGVLAGMVMNLDEKMAVYVALDILLRPPEDPSPLKDVQT